MKLSDLMRASPLRLAPRDPAGLAAEMMLWAGIRHLPVVDDHRLVGLVTERELAIHQAAVGLPRARTTPVEEVMVRSPQTAHPDDSVTEAAARMAGAKIDCLPVVELGRLVGIVTITDVLSAQVREALTAPARGGPRVTEVMARDPATAHEDDPLLDAAARMQQRRVRHLPVIDGEGHVLGMLSDRDVRTAVGDPGRAFEPGQPPGVALLRVADVMSRPGIATEAETTCAEAAALFIDARIGALPVVDADDRLVGIVSYVDLLRPLAGSPP